MIRKLLSVIPPLYLFVALCMMVLLHFFLPGAQALIFPWNVLGIVPLVIGVALNLVADKAFKKHDTTVKPLEESKAIITTGVFQYTRHPMYLGFVLILLGIAMLMGSISPYAVVVVFALFMDRVFIEHEEVKMEKTFGEAWKQYVAQVRRWI